MVRGRIKQGRRHTYGKTHFTGEVMPHQFCVGQGQDVTDGDIDVSLREIIHEILLLLFTSWIDLKASN